MERARAAAQTALAGSETDIARLKQALSGAAPELWRFARENPERSPETLLRHWIGLMPSDVRLADLDRAGLALSVFGAVAKVWPRPAPPPPPEPPIKEASQERLRIERRAYYQRLHARKRAARGNPLGGTRPSLPERGGRK